MNRRAWIDIEVPPRTPASYQTDEPNGRGCGEHGFANVTVGVL